MVIANGSWCCFGAISLHEWQVYHVFWISLFIPGQYTLLLPLELILVIPWCAECNNERMCFLNCVGIIIRLSIKMICPAIVKQSRTSQKSLILASGYWVVDGKSHSMLLIKSWYVVSDEHTCSKLLRVMSVSMLYTDEVWSGLSLIRFSKVGMTCWDKLSLILSAYTISLSDGSWHIRM